jgi:hypothetical protein
MRYFLPVRVHFLHLLLVGYSRVLSAYSFTVGNVCRPNVKVFSNGGTDDSAMLGLDLQKDC